ncbi:MAG: sce7726 family protein [Gemmatimonadales bacterium]
MIPLPNDIGGAIGPFRHGDSSLSDPEIRAAFSRGRGPSTAAPCLVLEEVECWRGYVRADYLCLAADTLSVIEIKSDRDSLRRFGEQVRVYSAVADRVTLIVGWRVAARALRAAPWWWDVVLAERLPTLDIQFVPLRDGAQNPSVAVDALAAMLPIDDVRRLARSVSPSLGRLRGQPLRHAVADHLSCYELRVAVHEWLARLSRKRDEIAS